MRRRTSRFTMGAVSDRARLASRVAGVVGIVNICAFLPLATYSQADWLARQGWSPTIRNPVQWPSILLLSPGAGLMTAIIWIQVTCTLIVALRFLQSEAPSAGALLILGSVSLAFTSVPPAPPPETTVAGTVHNLAYIGLVLAWIASTAAFVHSAVLRQDSRQTAMGATVLVLAALGIATGTSASIGQFGRYLVIVTMGVWIGASPFLLHDSRARPA